MKYKYKNIGLSGVAGSGKNTVSSILIKLLQRVGLPYRELSIAKNLKEELREPSLNLYNIDSSNCTRDEKNIIRPFLVSHGEIKRKLSKGRHWIDKITNELAPEKVNIITDVRFDEYEKDEVYWIKNEINGVLILIAKYEEINGKRIFLQPANAAEARNNPNLIDKADFVLNWPHEENKEKQIYNCKNLIRWVNNLYE